MIRTTFFLTGGPLLVGLCASAFAQTTVLAPHGARLGDHPAVVVQRLQAQRGYDYAAQFYPHPAWLYLRAAPTDAPVFARAAPVATDAAPSGTPSITITPAIALSRSDVE